MPQDARAAPWCMRTMMRNLLLAYMEYEQPEGDRPICDHLLSGHAEMRWSPVPPPPPRPTRITARRVWRGEVEHRWRRTCRSSADTPCA
mmetsp:Transcript_36815/g.83319  ORF Transcript_36815/g.83319 Transcript_36815/m.83319 type:complete len:89 (+) Transcript_36815:170-436(+)